MTSPDALQAPHARAIASAIRVAVIDGQQLFREGVAHALNRSGVFRVVGQGATSADATTIAKGEQPEIIILDVGTESGGLEAAENITAASPATKIVLLTISESGSYVKKALACGVKGYFLRSATGPELVDALRIVARGELYISPTLAARLLASSRAQPNLSDLTEREEQVLDRVARGWPNREIGRALNICEKTVKHYMTSIMQKLQVRNRVEAALKFRGGL